MKLTEIVEAFNENLTKEYGAILLYIELRKLPLMARNVKTAALISSLAEDEMHHAEMLADKIASLGGKSTWQIAPFERKSTVKETLIQIIESEEQAIEDYSDLIDRLADQPKLREMLIAILEDERRHKGRTEELLKSVSGRKTNP
jgi:bacterioferritin